MTPKIGTTRLVTVHGDTVFLQDLEHLFNISIQVYKKAWENHYMSFEIYRPLNNVDYCNVRIYTRQAQDLRLPLVNDIGHQVTPTKYQAMSPIYEFKAKNETLDYLIALVEKQEKKTLMTPSATQNIAHCNKNTFKINIILEFNLLN